MPNSTELPYILVPYEDLETMDSTGQFTALLIALAEAPVTPLERYYSTIGAHGSETHHLHTLVYLPIAPGGNADPVDVLLDGERICTMLPGECASVLQGDPGAKFDFEVGGRLTTPVEPPSDYVADGVIVSPEGLDSFTINTLESKNPWRTEAAHNLTKETV